MRKSSIKIIIWVSAVLFFISLASAAEQDVYFLLLKYDGHAMTTENVYVTKAMYVEEHNKTGEFFAEILSFDADVLYTRQFDIVTTFTSIADPRWFDEKGEQVTIPPPSRREEIAYKELLLPYFTHGKEIVIRKGNETVLVIPVLHFAKTCGDRVCQEHENELSCEEDCGQAIEKDKTTLTIVMIVIALALLGLWWWMEKKRNNI